MGKSVQAVGAGNLHVSVVEGRNFAMKDMGRGTLDPCVELLIGEEKVRTDTVRDTLSPSWLADFNLTVPSEGSHLWVSVLDEDQYFGREVLIGRAVVAISDLIGCGKRILWIHVKNLDNIDVGEVCLVLRYTDYKPPGTATQDKESNPLGLKALLSSSEATSASSDSMKYVTDTDGQQWRSVEVLEDVQPVDLISPLIQIEEANRTQSGPSSSSGTEIVKSVERAPNLHVKIDGAKRDEGSAAVKSRSGGYQYKMFAFTGAMVTILVAFVVGNYQKKRSGDQQQVGTRKNGIRYA